MFQGFRVLQNLGRAGHDLALLDRIAQGRKGGGGAGDHRAPSHHTLTVQCACPLWMRSLYTGEVYPAC